MKLINKIREIGLVHFPKVKSLKSPLEINVRLTETSFKQLNKEIVDMMNDGPTLESGLMITTENVHFTTLMLPEGIWIKVTQVGAPKDTVEVGDKSICIDSH